MTLFSLLMVLIALFVLSRLAMQEQHQQREREFIFHFPRSYLLAILLLYVPLWFAIVSLSNGDGKSALLGPLFQAGVCYAICLCMAIIWFYVLRSELRIGREIMEWRSFTNNRAFYADEIIMITFVTAWRETLIAGLPLRLMHGGVAKLYHLDGTITVLSGLLQDLGGLQLRLQGFAERHGIPIHDQYSSAQSLANALRVARIQRLAQLDGAQQTELGITATPKPSVTPIADIQPAPLATVSPTHDYIPLLQNVHVVTAVTASSGASATVLHGDDDDVDDGMTLPRRLTFNLRTWCLLGFLATFGVLVYGGVSAMFDQQAMAKFEKKLDDTIQNAMLAECDKHCAAFGIDASSIAAPVRTGKFKDERHYTLTYSWHAPDSLMLTARVDASSNNGQPTFIWSNNSPPREQVDLVQTMRKQEAAFTRVAYYLPSKFFNQYTAGDVVISFQITPNGRAINAKVIENGIQHPELNAKYVAVVNAMDWGAGEYAITDQIYTLHYVSGLGSIDLVMGDDRVK